MTLEEFVTARGPSLMRLAYVLTSDPYLAEDLAQSAMLEIHRNWARVREAEHPNAYARRILVNTYLSGKRRRRVEEELTGVDLEGGQHTDHADEIAQRDELREILAQFPVTARAILVLRYYEDMDDESIASLLGLNRSSVRASAARSLARIRQAIGTNTMTQGNHNG